MKIFIGWHMIIVTTETEVLCCPRGWIAIEVEDLDVLDGLSRGRIGLYFEAAVESVFKTPSIVQQIVTDNEEVVREFLTRRNGRLDPVVCEAKTVRFADLIVDNEFVEWVFKEAIELLYPDQINRSRVYDIAS